jgi:hypothetical protein
MRRRRVVDYPVEGLRRFLHEVTPLHDLMHGRDNVPCNPLFFMVSHATTTVAPGSSSMF